jgi:hypothetical protein
MNIEELRKLERDKYESIYVDKDMAEDILEKT